MSAPAPTSEDLARNLNRVRYGVLGIVGVCALWLFTQSGGEVTPLPATIDAGVTTAVICLALGAIVLRQVAGRPSAAMRTRVRALLGVYLCAGAIALAGFGTGLVTGEARRGISYALAAAIFTLGRPGVAAPAPRARRP